MNNYVKGILILVFTACGGLMIYLGMVAFGFGNPFYGILSYLIALILFTPNYFIIKSIYKKT